MSASEAMCRIPAWPGRHRCKLCGTTWHCKGEGCRPEANGKSGWNETLIFLKCDTTKTELLVENLKKEYREAKRRGRYLEGIAEKLQHATIKLDRLRGAMSEVYGGFSAKTCTVSGEGS